MIAAVTAGLLFSVPTITGLSFADDGSGSTSAAAPATSDQKGSDSSSSSSSSSGDSNPQTSDQQPKSSGDEGQTKVQGGPGSGPCEAQQCDKDGKPMSCSPHCYPPINWPKFPVKVIVHHDTKVIHESSSNGHQLTVAQQNCMYGALQLGFSSNAQNRVDATYAAMMGCLNQQQ